MKSGTRYYFSNISFPILFLRNIHRGVLSIEDADEEQGKVIKKLSNIDKNQSKKSPYSKCRISSSSKRKVLESFKSNKIKNPDTISTPGQTLDFPVFDTPKPTNAQTNKSKNRKNCMKIL